MIDTKNISLVKQKLKLGKLKKPVIIKARDAHFNRKILEYGNFQILLDVHDSNQIDKIKQLASGLNHVMAKIATKNKVAIGIDLKPLKKLGKKQKAIQTARIRQNIKICRKARTEIRLINFKDSKDAQAFLLSLGASTSQAKKLALPA